MHQCPAIRYFHLIPLLFSDILPPRFFPGQRGLLLPVPRHMQGKVAQMPRFSLQWFVLAVLVSSALAQTPELQTNVIYVCTDGQSFKVFSCDKATGGL